jgi:hypothetical protein
MFHHVVNGGVLQIYEAPKQLIGEVFMGTHRLDIANGIDDVLAEIKRQLVQIRYGSVEIQIHNGQVVQLESREKKRWDKGTHGR